MSQVQETQAQELARLRLENAALKARPETKLTIKIGEKGTLCLYGLGRYPVALYRSQWLRLLSACPEVAAFIKADDAGPKLLKNDK